MSEFKTASQIAAEEPADPEIRREHERAVLARAVAVRVIGYRIDHGLSQTGLARKLGMHQPAIARLEAGDHERSLAPCPASRGSSGWNSHRHHPRRLRATRHCLNARLPEQAGPMTVHQLDQVRDSAKL